MHRTLTDAHAIARKRPRSVFVLVGKKITDKRDTEKLNLESLFEYFKNNEIIMAANNGRMMFEFDAK